MPKVGLFARQSLEAALAKAEGTGYRRSLGIWSLTNIGIAAVIGAGIFVFLGDAARLFAGPAVVVSILISGAAAALAALAYAEFASMMPGNGSAYGYAYASLGRMPAFLLGWVILNSYVVGDAGVAIGWASLVKANVPFVHNMPEALLKPPGDGGIINLPATLVMLAVTGLCLFKVKESSLVNNLLVTLKLVIVVFVIVVGAFFIDPSNWGEAVPDAGGAWRGIISGAALIFFAYLGFETVSAAGEESRNPRRDLPLGILISVLVCAALYALMGGVLTGMQPASALDSGAPVTHAFRVHGLPWAAGIIATGAIVGLVTVLYAFEFSLARILHAMARDGFLGSYFVKLNPRTGTPWRITLWTGIPTALGAGLFSLRGVADMAVLAALFNYIFVVVGVLALKVVRPDAPRTFRLHWSLAVVAAILLCGLAFIGITNVKVHLYFWAWMGLGLALYGFWFHRRAATDTLVDAPTKA